jgi:hypothetical protein
LLKKISLFSILSVFLLSGCSNFRNVIGGCPDGEVKWIDVLKFNDIKYEGDNAGLSEGEIETGKKIGEVKFNLADNACSNHKLKNGDAAYLPVGTEIYELVGYRSDFRVVADNRVYQVRENKKAKMISDLLDIKDKVEKMSYRSDYDGSHISDFTDEETKEFVEDFLSLENLGYEKVEKQITDTNRVFLQIHLKDGSSFRIVYWLDENVLSTGAFGTEKMKRIVENKVDN